MVNKDEYITDPDSPVRASCRAWAHIIGTWCSVDT